MNCFNHLSMFILDSYYFFQDYWSSAGANLSICNLIKWNSFHEFYISPLEVPFGSLYLPFLYLSCSFRVSFNYLNILSRFIVAVSTFLSANAIISAISGSVSILVMCYVFPLLDMSSNLSIVHQILLILCSWVLGSFVLIFF